MNGLTQEFSQNKLDVYANPENRWRNEHQRYGQGRRTFSEVKSPVTNVEKGSFLHFFAGG